MPTDTLDRPPASAEARCKLEAGGFHAGAHAGALAHSRLGEVTGTLTAPDAGDLALDVDVRAEPSVVLGGSVGWRPTPSVALRVGAARTTTHMSLESPVSLDPVRTTLPSVTLGGGATVALGSSWSLLLEVSDHVSANPIADDDFRIGSSFAGIGKAEDLVHSFSFSGGLRVGF